MKTQTYKKWTHALLVLISAFSMMACTKDKANNTPPAVAPYPGYPGVGGNCATCANMPQGPVIFQGAAAAPNHQLFQIPGVQIMADPQGYQMAVSSGLRPLVNGSYPASVGGTFVINQPIVCGGGITYPPGTYTIQNPQNQPVYPGQPQAHNGMMQNGIFHAPNIVLVSNTGGVIQPAAVAMIVVDANLDNVTDRGSLLSVGFCGRWLDMNTL